MTRKGSYVEMPTARSGSDFGIVSAVDGRVAYVSRIRKDGKGVMGRLRQMPAAALNIVKTGARPTAMNPAPIRMHYRVTHPAQVAV